jgi:anti-sigma factor RsiW
MSCDEFRSLLQDYVTRELEPEKRRQVDTHLIGCGECQRELAVLTAVVSSLGNQPVVEPSADFTSRVMARLPRRQVFVPSPWLALLAAPFLAGIAWLARGWLLRQLFELGQLLGLKPDAMAQFRLPEVSSISYAQLALLPGIALVLTILLVAGGVVLGRRVFDSD